MTRLTRSQLDAVLASDVNLLVGAGAGSGKTMTVVQKLCYLLGAPIAGDDGRTHRVSAPLAMGQIAAITFTRQAASDLKRKLHAALVENGLGAAARETDAARIGTIHSFCGDILRDYALRAGIAPAQRILTEGESTSLLSDAARTVLHAAADESGAYGEAASPLARLAQGRRISEILTCMVRLAGDHDRLAAWEANATRLREHEATLLSLARRTASKHADELARTGAMDFNTMIVATRDLLRGDREVRRAVQRELRVLVVDEFQDVDPAQRDIALSLAGITEADPAPTRIVLVGDPKQSIYRFRGADVALWNDVARRFQDGGAGMRVELADNFRSKRGILALVDGLIGTRLAAPVQEGGPRRDFEVDYAPLVARSADCDGDECVELLCIPPGSDGKTMPVGRLRELEAAALAARVAELRETGTPYGDMALLLASWSDVDTYESALTRAGIPTYALRATGFWEAREVVDCVLALRAIRDAGDSVALVGFLKGPFICVRDETLLALAKRAHPQPLARALREEPLERELLDRAVGLLDRFGALRDRVPVHELLDALLYETGFLACLALDERRGMQAIANVRKLLRLAAATPEASLGAFLRMVAESRERGDKEGEERLYRERADVVTITSVHSAKGLEWPVVFWCDLAREARADSEALLCGRELFRLREIETVNEDGDAVDDGVHAELLAELRLEAQAESLRLWYVASTRPQRLLVLSGIPLGAAKPTKSVASLIRSHFGDALLSTPAPGRVQYLASDGEAFRVVVHTAPSIR